MVKSGISNSLPLESKIFDGCLVSTASTPSVEVNDDNELEDGDCLGVSEGDAEMELEEEMGSVVDEGLTL